MGGLTRRGAALSVVSGLLLTLAVAAGARAAEPRFGTPTIEASFEQGLTIEQPVNLDETPYRVELLLTTGDDSGPLVIEVPAPRAGQTTLRWSRDGDVGHLAPNTQVQARWRITPTRDAEPVLGPEAAEIYDDDRFDWQTVEGDVVRVHWYDGSRAFGERALAIGEAAVRETTELLGVTEDEPVDFFIYSAEGPFYDALGPGTRENVGGQANADIRTLFALIRPNAIDDPWVGVVVPHELVHLVFDTAVDNPYHFPPRWLNEGLAMYLSDGYPPGDRSAVEAAGRDGRLIPLDGLTGQFPTTFEGFSLAYSESVSAVDYLIRTHGQDAMVDLISSYADGRTDDEAFEAAIGQDTAAFGAAWLADLGVPVPPRLGPQPAPAGPAPPDWEGAPAPGTTPAPAPGTTPPPAVPATPGTAPAPGAPDRPVAEAVGPVLVVLAIVLLAAGGLVVVRMRDQRRRHAGPDGRGA
jgi:hypothetical protein